MGKHHEIAKLLVEKEADATINPLIYHAIYHQDRKMTDFLLEKGADITIPYVTATGKSEPFGLAVARNDKEFVDLLLSKGIDPNKKVNYVWYNEEKSKTEELYTSPLMLAAMCGAYESFKSLLEKGAKPNNLNNNKETALDVFEKATRFNRGYLSE